MAKFFIPLLFLFVFSITATAQKTYRYSDKLFTYKVKVDSVLSGDSVNFNCLIKSVEILRNSDHKIIQTIHPPQSNFSWSMDKDVIFITEDMNFDGINDFRVLNLIGTSVNELYYCWLFDKVTHQFKRCKRLEDITSPEFSKDEQLIYSSWAGGCCLHGSSIYKWISGRPVLIEEDDVIQGGDDKNLSDTILTKKRIKGKMRLVKKTVE